MSYKINTGGRGQMHLRVRSFESFQRRINLDWSAGRSVSSASRFSIVFLGRRSYLCSLCAEARMEKFIGLGMKLMLCVDLCDRPLGSLFSLSFSIFLCSVYLHRTHFRISNKFRLLLSFKRFFCSRKSTSFQGRSTCTEYNSVQVSCFDALAQTHATSLVDSGGVSYSDRWMRASTP